MASRSGDGASRTLTRAALLGLILSAGAPAVLPRAHAAPADTAAVQVLTSPDGHLSATLTAGDELRYALALDGRTLIAPSPLSMTLGDGRVLGRPARLLRVDRLERAEEIATPLGKRAKVRNVYREAALRFTDGAVLRAHVFDDGFALRWETTFFDRIRVRDEGFSVVFPEEPEAFFLGGTGAHHGYEGLWRHQPISGLWPWSAPAAAALPIVFDLPGGSKLALLQADLDDYPAMYLSYRLSQPRALVSLFPRRVTREQPGGFLDFDLVAAERADDIALTAGTRSFPWRAATRTWSRATW
jgi:alpha-glucosidase